MTYTVLGGTGIRVSRLCFGSLTLGPIQANLPLEEGAAVAARAIERGVTFFDTAQLYRTYPYLRRAMEITGRHDIVIASKTYAHTRALAAHALDEARRALDRDMIDIFLLHEQESIHTLRGHREALEYLLEQKQRGTVSAVGASTHHIAAAEGVLNMGLDVLHPLLNLTGLGIADGSRDEMERAVGIARNGGVGVYLMKPLGGGNFFNNAAESLRYAFSRACADSVALGMQSIAEVDANIEFFETGRFSPDAAAALAARERRLLIDTPCTGCGACADRCPAHALRVDTAQNRACWDAAKCLFCGYCAPVCPVFAIRVV